jgi:hypothetical protein
VQNGPSAGNVAQIFLGGLGVGGNLAAGGRQLSELAQDAGRLRVEGFGLYSGVPIPKRVYLAPSDGATSLTSIDPRLRPGYDPSTPQLDHIIAEVFGGTETRLVPAGLNLRKGGLEGELRKYENYLVNKGMRPEAARQVIQSEIESLSRDVIAAPFTNVYSRGFSIDDVDD